MGHDDIPGASDTQQSDLAIPLGARMRRAREDKGITLTDLADRLDYAKSHLSSVETGQRIPSSELVKGYERELGLPPGDLAFDVGGVAPIRALVPRRMHASMPVPLTNVLNEVAPIDPTAQRLLDSAQAEAARQAQALDVTHIMFSVVRASWSIDEVRDSPAITRLLTNPRVMDVLWGALWALVNTSLLSSPDWARSPGAIFEVSANRHYIQYCTDVLRRCLSLIRVQWPDLPLNDAMLVWTILNDNNPARNAVAGILEDFHEPILDDIIAELRRRVGDDVSNQQVNITSVSDLSHWLPERLALRPSAKYGVRHRELLLDVADAIQEHKPRQFVLISGQNGSPLHHVPQILSDAIGAGMIQFDNLKSVWWANIMDYLRWASSATTPVLEMLLHEGIEHVKAHHGILVLEHVEKLGDITQQSRTPLQQHLFGQLRSVPDAAILALYQTHSGANPESAMEALGLVEEESILIPIEPYTVEHALHTLCDTFVPEWKERGFVFEGDVADGVSGPYCDLLALRAGAKMHGKPMALPYLLVDVTEHLFTRRDEPASVRGWAKSATDRVNELLAQRPNVHPASLVHHYLPLLMEALQQMQPLKANPAMKRRGGHVVVTRRHLTAAFLGSAFSRFTYPDSL